MEQLVVYLEFILEKINIKSIDRSIDRLKRFILFSFISFFVFFTLNEVNKGYKQPLVKPFWQIFLIGLILGLMITILDMFSPFKNKKVVADDD